MLRLRQGAAHTPSVPHIQTLFVHPDVKIVQFASGGKAALLDIDAARLEAGTLPPYSRLERTIAVGRYSRHLLTLRLPILTMDHFPCRHIVDISWTWLCSLPQLWLRTPTDSPQESMLGHRRDEWYLHFADTSAELLENRVAVSDCGNPGARTSI